MSTRLKDGGPAFPRAATLDPMGGTFSMAQGGMSVRAYYAAHAPEMPDWWEWTNPVPRPATPRADKELSQEHYAQWQGLGDYFERKDVAPEVIAFEERFSAVAVEVKEWTVLDRMGKLTAWRRAYAESMVATDVGAGAAVDDGSREQLLEVLVSALRASREMVRLVSNTAKLPAPTMADISRTGTMIDRALRAAGAAE